MRCFSALLPAPTAFESSPTETLGGAMKKLLLALASVLFLAIPLYAPRDAQAVPAFARQTGMACNACHFQHYPALNAFGRAFKQEAYTLKGKQETIEDENLSLPVDLNKKGEGVNYGIVPFLTDGGGVSYGMELLNTGAQRFIRVAENRTATAAQQFVGSSGGVRPGGSEATGFAFVASAPQWFANFSL